jgi:hypothetical protein
MSTSITELYFPGRISSGIIYIYGLYTDIYVVHSIISWIGLILALLCTTADTWNHEIMPCPFFSRSSKKQLRACGILRKKVTVVKGSCLRATEIENVAA